MGEDVAGSLPGVYRKGKKLAQITAGNFLGVFAEVKVWIGFFKPNDKLKKRPKRG